MENIDRIAKLKKIVEGTEAEHIIKHVKENPGTTIDKVARHLEKEDICSRLTTLKVIDELVKIGMLEDRRNRRYFHRLYYNEEYDFSELGIKLLTGSLDEMKNAYRVLSKDDEYVKMFDELKAYIIKTKHKRRAKKD